MLRRTIGALALPCFAAACAGLQIDNDPTPLRPTAVLELRQSSTGLQDFPAFEAVTLSQSRANMQRSESRVKGGGSITQWLDADSGARIERLDKKVAWTLDAKNKVAVECPMKGCLAPAPKKAPATKPVETGHPRDPECRMKTGVTAVTVEPTGQKRSINGFNAEQYDVKWTVTFRDNAARVSTSTAALDIWATTVTADLKEAMSMEQSFFRGRDRLLGTDTETERAGALPPEAGRMISAYLAPNVSPTDRAKFLAGAKKIDKVPGMPVLTTVKWSFAGDACSIGDGKEGGDKPLFTFTSEVRMRKTESRHDSVFAVPKDYKITK